MTTLANHCADCGAPIHDPWLTGGLNVCEHRRACEGRQLLAAGHPVAVAAAHAQNLQGFDIAPRADTDRAPIHPDNIPF